MAQKPETLFGQIARDLGYLDEQDIEKLMAAQRKTGGEAPIAMLAVRSGMLTQNQVQEILDAQELRRAPAAVSAEESGHSIFGKLAPETGMADRRAIDKTSMPRLFDPSAKLFGGPGDSDDLRQKISRARSMFGTSPARPAPAAATPPHPRESETFPAPAETPAPGQLGGPGGLRKFALHGTAKGPSEYDKFLTALDNEASATETSGTIFTAALGRALNDFSGPAPPAHGADTIYRQNTASIKRGAGPASDDITDLYPATDADETMANLLTDHGPDIALKTGAGQAYEEIVDLHPSAPSASADEAIETFFTDPGSDVIELVPRAEAEARRADSIDTHETAELLEHELPSSDVYDRAVLIAAEKIPATPPGGIMPYRGQAATAPPRPRTRAIPAPPGQHPAWRKPRRKPNWILDHWLIIVIILAGVGAVALVAWIIYLLLSLIF